LRNPPANVGAKAREDRLQRRIDNVYRLQGRERFTVLVERTREVLASVSQQCVKLKAARPEEVELRLRIVGLSEEVLDRLKSKSPPNREAVVQQVLDSATQDEMDLQLEVGAASDAFAQRALRSWQRGLESWEDSSANLSSVERRMLAAAQTQIASLGARVAGLQGPPRLIGSWQELLQKVKENLSRITGSEAPNREDLLRRRLALLAELSTEFSPHQDAGQLVDVSQQIDSETATLSTLTPDEKSTQAEARRALGDLHRAAQAAPGRSTTERETWSQVAHAAWSQVQLARGKRLRGLVLEIKSVVGDLNLDLPAVTLARLRRRLDALMELSGAVGPVVASTALPWEVPISVVEQLLETARGMHAALETSCSRCEDPDCKKLWETLAKETKGYLYSVDPDQPAVEASLRRRVDDLGAWVTEIQAPPYRPIGGVETLQTRITAVVQDRDDLLALSKTQDPDLRRQLQSYQEEVAGLRRMLEQTQEKSQIESQMGTTLLKLFAPLQAGSLPTGFSLPPSMQASRSVRQSRKRGARL